SPMKATELYRNVLRTSSEDEDIRKAGKLAIDLEEMTDTLGELEKVVSPLSFMMAHKPVYRQVLVELYLRYVPRLVERVRQGDAAVLADVLPVSDHQELAMREAATLTLGRSGDKRAVAPLVKALGDNRHSVKQLACLGLAHIDDPRGAAAVIAAVKDTTQNDS